MTATRRNTIALVAALTAATTAHAQVLFNDHFDSDSSADWSVKVTSPDTSVTFAFDYSTMGIPPAPRSAGTTIGLRLAANIEFPTGAQAVTLSPVGTSFNGDFQLTFDAWINANGPFPAGGAGSTEYITAGIGYDDATNNLGGASGSGAWFGYSGEGGASRDYQAFKNNFEQFAGSGQFLAGNSSAGGGAHNASDPYYAAFGGIDVANTVPAQTALHPDQNGTIVVGAGGFAWREITVTVSGTSVTWAIDGLPIATLTQAAGAFPLTGNISVGYMDPFSSVSDNPAVSFGIIDNVSVCIGQCELIQVTGACCFANGTCDDLAEAACIVAGGTSSGAGTDCAGTTCDITFGACCFTNGFCDDAFDEEECLAAEGTFTVGFECGEIVCQEQISGPDMIYWDATDVSNWGAIGNIRGYSFGSNGCNVGDQNLHWGNAWNGSPVLANNVYRLHEGRLEMIGLSWAKHACCVTVTHEGCGVCNGVNGTLLGAGCRDIYGSVYNGRQDRMGPRSAINAFSGNIPTPATPNTGNAIYKRIQVAETDLLQEPDGALYFIEGVVVGDDDAPAQNAMNNASYKQFTVNESTFDLATTGEMYRCEPAILAWQQHGNGMNQPDNDVVTITADIPGEGRFFVAAKVSDNGDGTHRYEYAVFNLNSHRSAGSFQIPVPAGTQITNAGFHDVDHHSGEVYDNTDWNTQILPEAVLWESTTNYAQNPDGNAIRWGLMYNFWFDADAAPADGEASVGLFIPGTPTDFNVTLPVPAGCPCDLDNDQTVDVTDLLAYLELWFGSDPAAELSGDVPAQVDVVDLLNFLTCWFPTSSGLPCP